MIGIAVCVMMVLLCFPAQAECDHSWQDGVCQNCGQVCTHDWEGTGWCSICDVICYHDSWTDGVCDSCKYACDHYWDYGVCQTCGAVCQHEWEDGCCYSCGTFCYHPSWTDGRCSDCQAFCYHYYDRFMIENGICSLCGQPCTHDWLDGVCYVCDAVCGHSWFDGSCTVCDIVCEESHTEGICSVCGMDADLGPVGCLRGDFNNWACEYNMSMVDEKYLSIMVPVEKKGIYNFTLHYDGKTYAYSYAVYPDFHCKLHTGSSIEVDFAHPGTYVFYLEIETLDLVVMYVPENMYVRGSFNGWSEDVLLTAQEDGSYTTTLLLEPGEYEFEVTDGVYYSHKLSLAHTVSRKSYVTVYVCMYQPNGIPGFISVGNKPVVVVPNLTLDYPSLSFEGEIRYNVYYSVDDAASVEEMGLITFSERLEDGTVDNAVDIIPGYVSS